MSQKIAGKMQLSKSILEMKFMRKTKDKVEKQMFQEAGEEYFENQLTHRMKKESGKFTLEQSFVFCEQLVDGRLSFQGMNPEIEKIMEEERLARLPKEKSPEVDISDEKLGKEWRPSLVNTMNRKFKPKRQHNQAFPPQNGDSEHRKKKMKFLKPSD